MRGPEAGATLKAAAIAGPAGAAIGAAAGEHALDLELAQRHCRGDARAFDEVYARYAEMVFNLALRLAGDADEAADLTQEVFLRIHRHLEGFSGRSALKTWVFRVALNHCRERLSRFRPLTRPLRDESDESEAVPLVDPRRGPEDLAVTAELGRRLARALTLLPVPFREAVVLRDLQGLSYQEIAEVLRVRVGTVRSRIARGREQLRLCLERQEPRHAGTPPRRSSSAEVSRA
jgi:RNA polymerase sigma-70 factor (ECF subfamily)